MYDLYLFSGRPFDKGLGKKLVVVKCWNAREPLNSEEGLGKVANTDYGWDDLQRLVRKGDLPSQAIITKTVLEKYAFLKDLDNQLQKIINDSKVHRDRQPVAKLLSVLSSS